MPGTTPSGKEYSVHILLFAITVLSTLTAGSFLSGGNPLQNPADLKLGTGFSFTLLSILMLHELSHYFAARAHKTSTSLPFFIPAPTFIGTFGAVIKMRSPIMNRKALLDVGVSGPMASFFLSVIAVTAGLGNSQVVEKIPEESIRLGDSLIFSLLVRMVKGSLEEGSTVMLSPVAFAGWIGLLVTSLNLIPASQLDGGHVMYSVAGQRYTQVAVVVVLSLLVLGFFWSGWFIWAFLVLLLGLYHPPPADDSTPVDRKRRALAISAMVIFILTFVPVPISH